MSTKPPSTGTDWLKQQRATASAAATPAPPACNGEDAVDSRVERFLQEHGVKYAPKSQIPIDMVDEKSSLANQARDVPILPESVDRYAGSLRKGEYLPPIVVFPNGNRVTIVDGNNRFAAHKKAGSRFVPGFVIDENTPSETIALLTVAANNDHGVTPDSRWRKRQASHLVSIGFTVEQASNAAGITKAQLNDFQALTRADARAKFLRVTTGWNELSETGRTALGRIHMDSVFYQAARVAIETKMDADTCKALLRDVKAIGSENDQIAHITNVSEQRRLEAKAAAATGANNRMSSPKQAIVTALGKIMHCDPAELARNILTDTDRQLLLRRIDDAVDKLAELQGALSDAQVRNAG